MLSDHGNAGFTKPFVALKLFDLENFSSSFEDLLQEVQTMSQSYCTHILRCESSFVVKDQLWMITELMDRGSCQRVMKICEQSGLGEGFRESCVRYILGEMMKGVSYLHERGLIHR